MELEEAAKRKYHDPHVEYFRQMPAHRHTRKHKHDSKNRRELVNNIMQFFRYDRAKDTMTTNRRVKLYLDEPEML